MMYSDDWVITYTQKKTGLFGYFVYSLWLKIMGRAWKHCNHISFLSLACVSCLLFLLTLGQTINMSPRFDWQAVMSQSACTDTPLFQQPVLSNGLEPFPVRELVLTKGASLMKQELEKFSGKLFECGHRYTFVRPYVGRLSSLSSDSTLIGTLLH